MLNQEHILDQDYPFLVLLVDFIPKIIIQLIFSSFQVMACYVSEQILIKVIYSLNQYRKHVSNNYHEQLQNLNHLFTFFKL